MGLCKKSCHGQVLAGRVCEQAPAMLPALPPSSIPCASSRGTAEGSCHRPPHLPGLIHRGPRPRTPVDLPQVPAQGTCVPAAAIRHIPAPRPPWRVADTVVGMAPAGLRFPPLGTARPVLAHLRHEQWGCCRQPQPPRAPAAPRTVLEAAFATQRRAISFNSCEPGPKKKSSGAAVR